MIAASDSAKMSQLSFLNPCPPRDGSGFCLNDVIAIRVVVDSESAASMKVLVNE